MSELNVLIRKRGNIKHKLTNFVNYVNALSASIDENLTDTQLKELQLRINNCNEIFKNFKDVQEQIECICDEDKIEEHLEYDQQFTDNCISTLALANSLLDQLNNKLSKKGTASAENSVDTNRNGTNALRHVKLPTISLPKFRGDYKGWLEFKDTFESLIHLNSEINNIQKFHYLRASLQGDAAKVIQALEFSAENYHSAWELLSARFNNTRLLVHNHLRSLFEIPSLNKETANGLRNIIDSVSEHLRALETLKQPIQYWDTLIIFILMNKLDKTSAREWERLKIDNEFPSLKEFTNFLKNRADFLETFEINVNSGHKSIVKESKIGIKQLSLVASNPSCNYCKQSHTIYKCEEFLNLTPTARLDKVKELKLCPNCLWSGHEVKKCRALPCRKCKSRHNSLLHQDAEPHEPLASQSSTKETQIVLSTHSKNKYVLLSTVLIGFRNTSGKEYIARALLDSGSQSNFISERLCEMLNLERHATNVSIVGINTVKSNFTKCEVTVHSLNHTFSSRVTCYVLPKITNNLPSQNLDINSWKIPSNLCLADPRFHQPGKIDFLIGAGLFWQILGDKTIKLERGLPILRETTLGWIISGEIDKPNKTTICHFTRTLGVDEELRKFWEIEEVSNPTSLSLDDSECEKFFSDTTTRDESGRFVVKIPLRHSPTLLGDSKETAVKRFCKLENKFLSMPKFKQDYVSFMREYKDMNHMSLQPSAISSNSYFLPHHGIIKEDSLTTKMRVVFDGSSPSASGWSVNDLQCTGPSIINDLLNILLRFRQHRFVVTADVVKMYRQILVHPNDRYLQQIVWRENPEDDLQVYCLNTVTYGTTSAPYLAIRCLKELAYENQSSFPTASAIIERDFYVDDLITGFNSESEAILICQEISNILETANFPLRKWHSNSKKVVNGLKVDDDPISIIQFGEQGSMKTLGVFWNSNLDTFTYKIASISQNIPASKRAILSQIAKIFDPLGLLSPSVIVAKMILQKLWSLKLDWDDPLPSELANKWCHFRNSLYLLNNLQLQRQVINIECQRIELHAFCDASQDAYAACIYMRSVHQEVIQVHLLCAKTKVAPLKALTIPRLELCGALLLARLVKKVTRALTISFDSFYWTDSTIVLGWLKTTPKALQSFVSNRVSEIQSLTHGDRWNHIRSKDNPADLASRGLSPETLLSSQLWWQGPPWLTNPICDWPESLISDATETLPELKTTHYVMSSTQFERFPIENFSNLSRLQRVVAYCLRFIKNCRRTIHNRVLGHLSVEELETSMKILVKIAQHDDFSREIEILNHEVHSKTNHNLSSLSAFLDGDNLIRVGGRLKNSNLSFDAKHPLLLKGKHHLTKLILEHRHRALYHAGPQLLLSHVRQNFWPTSGIQAAKNVIRSCLRCFKFRPRTTIPVMADLPKKRVTIASPFENTGVDYAGPFILKDRKGRGAKTTKSYVCLFVCFVTKAVHVELATELTLEAFISCLRRFTARRGLPSHIFSDNGTNFVGANNCLKEWYKLISNSTDKIATTCATQGITWHFIPPNSPHFGGLWEAGVGSIKRHLLKTIGHTLLTFDEFYTVLAQVEAILNSRPLYPLSSDPNDLLPLTPAHFLIGRSLIAAPDPTVLEIPTNRLTRFQLVQQISQRVWKRWSNEYLHTMQSKQKWREQSKIPTVGTLVIIKQDHAHPLQWLLGRVIEVHPGNDGVVRVVSVKTQKGILKRAVARLCVLPESCNEQL